MNLKQRFPAEQEIPLEAFVALLGPAARRAPKPFSAETLEFCAAFSEELFRSPAARALPEAQALAFWLRPAEIQRLKARFTALETDGALLAPRGLVFHIPPGNVDTLFIYSWLFALLTGNASVIRLPSAPSPAVEAVLAALEAVLSRKAFSTIAESLWIVSYGHEAEISSALSLKADVRVIWGGDDTVRRLRALPLSPLAKDLAFPDRYSFCAVKTMTYLELDAAGRQALAERFYNDAYWFGQQACSSPRLVLWFGPSREVGRCRELFFGALDDVLSEKGLRLDAPDFMQKLAFSYAAVIERPVKAYRSYRNELTVLQLSGLEGLSRRHCGAGLFFDAHLAQLSDLLPFIAAEDQTMSQFGFSREELTAFARELGGRGLHRIVPLGEALGFHRFWDGFDLLQEMTQRVYVKP